MKNKILAISIMLLFILLGIVPNTIGNFEKISPISSVKINDEERSTQNITIPDCVEVGDILLIDGRPDESTSWKRHGPYNEHAVLYRGNNSFIEADSINGVEEHDNYEHFYKRAKNLVFLRVKSANPSQKQAAVDWAFERIGEEYQFVGKFPWFGLKIANPDFPNPIANKWYCTELVWAAYYNQDIDIDRNGWGFPPWVIAEEIIYDNDIEIIYREINDSTEFIKPYKGVYIKDKKIIPAMSNSSMSNSTIFGNITVEVETLNENITKMDFYINNTYKANDTTKPYTWNWNERCCGKKVIIVVASDDFGNQYFTNITVKKYF